MIELEAAAPSDRIERAARAGAEAAEVEWNPETARHAMELVRAIDTVVNVDERFARAVLISLGHAPPEFTAKAPSSTSSSSAGERAEAPSSTSSSSSSAGELAEAPSSTSSAGELAEAPSSTSSSSAGERAEAPSSTSAAGDHHRPRKRHKS